MSQRMTILLVEDEEDDAELTKRAFAKAGIEADVEVIQDGGTAAEYLCASDSDRGKPLPNLVLMDVKLPTMRGMEVVRKFKETEGGKRTPVLMLTSAKDDIDVAEAYAAGANSYLVKPVSFDAFVEVANAIRLYWITYNAAPKEA